ncbi:MAG: GNAT family N-acetyltransferase [Phycisphaerales bacterium]|nr:GNAT family N-acetyltransferase [Phycisphaerales bacterium]
MTQPRPLTPDDAPRYVALRLRMVTESPWSFLGTPGDDAGLDEAIMAQRLAEPENKIFAVEGDAGELIAAAGIYRSPRIKTQHKANIWGVYVAPEARGRGLGRAVMQSAIDAARTWPGVCVISLSVTERAPAAKALYESLGFKTWGVEPNATGLDGQYIDEIWMQLVL